VGLGCGQASLISNPTYTYTPCHKNNFPLFGSKNTGLWSRLRCIVTRGSASIPPYLERVWIRSLLVLVLLLHCMVRPKGEPTLYVSKRGFGESRRSMHCTAFGVYLVGTWARDRGFLTTTYLYLNFLRSLQWSVCMLNMGYFYDPCASVMPWDRWFAADGIAHYGHVITRYRCTLVTW